MSEWDQFRRAESAHEAPDQWEQFAQAEPASPPRQSRYPSSGMQLPPFGEAALSVASRVPAGLVGLGAGAMGAMLPGEPGQGQRYMEKAAGALTYQPRDQAGRVLTRMATAPFVKLSELAQGAGQYTARKTDSPLAGALTEATLDMIPSLITGGARSKPVRGYVEEGKAAAMAEQARNAARDANLKEITDAGYVFPATRTDPSFAKKKLESVAGKAALDQEASMRNQAKTNELSRRAASLEPDSPITPQTLEVARERLSGPYREVSRLSPTAASAWEAARQAKADAKAEWNYYNRQGNPETLKKAKELDREVAFYEDMVEQEATALGRQDMLPQLREARKQLAKNYDVERALNSTTGDVDARVLGRMYEKDKGQRMTGELATIGKFANMFPRDARSPAGVPTPGVHNLEMYGAAGLGLGGHATGMGWWPMGIVAAGGPARSLSLSKFMQSQPEYKPGRGVRLADIASKDGLPLTSALGLRLPEQEEY
jgi:hypothetical protein